MCTPVVFEFHVSRAARDRYHFDELLFAFNGNVVFANALAARHFATRMNAARGVERDPSRAVRPAALYAMGLIDEALHAIVALYRSRYDERATVDALPWFEARLGRDALQRTLLRFVTEFPPVRVYRKEQTPEEWLRGATAGLSHRAVALEELAMLWLANANPAFRPFAELFDETPLTTTAYRDIAAGLRDYFETRPRIGALAQNLIDVLRAPALVSPESLAGQLAYLREQWGAELGEFMQQLLVALDVLKEEEIAIWTVFHPPGQFQRRFGAPQDMGDSSAAAIPHFGEREPEYERFSPDVDWMPSTVLLAKSVYVWLDQLAKEYRRPIHRLNEVPDQELDLMSRRGFNALWLIGVWERSSASRRIKQLMGNPDAAASAYSLYDYAIADDLGGSSAYQNLRDRAALRGIRLASDMVPNHMGIDSRWVMEHPDWFISLPYSPFPAYSFNGPDLSHDGRVEIKIEDHYYDRTDAAVVFRRVDRWSGDTRYVYHGNDGTTFPWNDTAQLNYLNPQVREAVIQTILHVARMFPIIRFDAAMTLTKQHYQRLWFPAPGTGGAIPSRAEHGLTKQQFDEAMPHEFWRELVDRVAAEVPGTLLLAEAFWLLEGYFVRTLGMHRVYNSAFMNMLRDEENANYRSVLKNTLEFDPEVLKRYVNFMNNPDERTAVDQFGKGDKYFGICTLLATLPGLPMFGHGQIEGLSERYGMEFRRAMRDEQPDPWLVARHEREITPLLHRRRLFAEVRDFLMYDFFTDSGSVNEDVFAYSNRLGHDRALIVYHNRYADTHGWVRVSCGYAEKQPDGSKQIRQRTLGDAFGLNGDPAQFVACRDAFNGQEFLYRARDVYEKGLRFHLGAYQCQVLLDWREMREDAGHPWSELCDWLGGRGVPSLDEALLGIRLRPLHAAFAAVLEPDTIDQLIRVEQGVEAELADVASAEIDSAALAADRESSGADATDSATSAKQALRERALRFFAEAQRFMLAGNGTAASAWDTGKMATAFETLLDSVLQLPNLLQATPAAQAKEAAAVLPISPDSRAAWGGALAWALLQAAATVAQPKSPGTFAVELFDTTRLRHAFADAVALLGEEGEERWRAAARLRFAFAHGEAPRRTPGREATPTQLSWLHDPEVAWLIGSHEHQGEQYFNQELFERLAWWSVLPAMVEATKAVEPRAAATKIANTVLDRCRKAKEAGYRVQVFVDEAGVL